MNGSGLFGLSLGIAFVTCYRLLALGVVPAALIFALLVLGAALLLRETNR